MYVCDISVLLTITLKDVNDNAPDFSEVSYNASVMENAVNGAILTTIDATDKDTNRTITYGIIPTTNAFAIHQGT